MPRAGRTAVLLLGGVLLGGVLRATVGWAQVAPPPGGPLPTVPGASNPHGPRSGGPREVSGRVERLTRSGAVPAAGVMVTLHRVGSDREGPIDSVRTGVAGRYRIPYRAIGDARAIYFAATTWHGIAYFTKPLRAAQVTGNDARLTVFDTASRGVPLSVRGRHVIVSAADSSGSRFVIEVYELANDSVRTLVGTDSMAATITLPVPALARDVAVGQGDVPPDAARPTPGALEVLAPFAPGLKQLSFSYRIDQAAFPMSLALDRAADVLEVLIEEPTATVSGAALQHVGPVAADGRTFKRFLGQNIASGGALAIAIPGSMGGRTRAYIIGVVFAIGLALLAGLARTAFVTRGARGPRAVMLDDDPERLARDIADLDRAQARSASPTDEARDEYARARTALRARLTLALARRDGDA